jgi:hypothetical protein
MAILGGRVVSREGKPWLLGEENHRFLKVFPVMDELSITKLQEQIEDCW